jgi:hypothetical protein
MKVYCVIADGMFYNFVNDGFEWEMDFECITKSKELAEKCREDLLRFHKAVGIVEGEIV